MSAADHRVHFIGIGGVGVSTVAKVLHQRGVYVQGSDVRQSALTEALEALGVQVTIGHAAGNIGDCDTVVHSTAVPLDNVERVAAQTEGRTAKHRSEMLSWCLEGQESIGVAGTHGKGTVSAMITECLIAGGKDPTFLIGGVLNNLGTNARAGEGGYAVAEIDESDGSHLNLQPEHVVVNNLEVDHLNYYDDLDDIIGHMADFIGGNPRLKTLALNWDDAGVRALAGRLKQPFLKYGTEGELDYGAREVTDLGDRVRFQAWQGDTHLGEVTLPIPGNYNADNAAGAMAIAMGAPGLDFETVQTALNGYRGLENRFTVRRAGGLTIVKDYISHPTGMRRVLDSARRIMASGAGQARVEHARIWCVFKPYRFTLMHYHGEEYAQAFTGCDEVVITKMYAAEEKPIDGVDTPWFVDLLRKAGNTVHYVEENPAVVPFLSERVQPGDMVIFFGGDDFFRMADAWADTL